MSLWITRASLKKPCPPVSVWMLVIAGVVGVLLATRYVPAQFDANHAAWETLVAQLKVDEGFRSKPYRDTAASRPSDMARTSPRASPRSRPTGCYATGCLGMRDCLIRGHKPFADYSSQVRNVLLNMTYEIGCLRHVGVPRHASRAGPWRSRGCRGRRTGFGVVQGP